MVILTFLGTKGYIDPESSKHRFHTSLLITHQKKRIMIDCGEGWEKRLKKVKPDAIVLTHAHPDHAFGLVDGAPCPVYATKTTWKLIKNFPIREPFKKIIKPYTPKKIFGITFEAYPVIHSLKAPAVGYRVSFQRQAFFYVPDVVWIKDLKSAFEDILFYIGDGATVFRPMVRKDKKTGKIFGHANIRQQLTWCKKRKVPQMIVTHCGSDIVGKRAKKSEEQIERFAKERNVQVCIAYDGMKLKV